MRYRATQMNSVNFDVDRLFMQIKLKIPLLGPLNIRYNVESLLSKSSNF